MESSCPSFFPQSLIIDGPRLRLTPLQDSDAEDLCLTALSPIVTRAVHILRDGLTISSSRELIAKNSTTNVLCGIRLKATDTLIGAFRLHRHQDEAVEVGYWLDVDWHGKGFAKEALNLVLTYLANHPAKPQVIAECDPTNTASHILLEKSGFSCTDQPGVRPGRKRYEFQPIGYN